MNYLKQTLSILIIFSGMVSSAQMKQGKVIYERITQMSFRFQNVSPEMEKSLPKTQTAGFELLFGNNQTLWQSLPDVNQEAGNISTVEGEGRRMSFVMMGNDDLIYHDLDKMKKISARELGSKNYIVDDTITKLSWKLTGESKKILDYNAQKATAFLYYKRMMMAMENGEMKRTEVPDTVPVTAWFTSEIPVAAGPVYQGQLPGLILELDINNGRTVYKATEVSDKVNLSAIKEPKKGKHITIAEFNKERDRLIEERRNSMPSNGRRITISGGQ